MQIIQKVLIKQVITEKSKQTLRHTFEQEVVQLDRECQQLLFEQRKLQNKVKNKQDISERFQIEIEKRKDQIAMTEFKLEQLELLEIGSEIIEKEIDGLIHVEVGMTVQDINPHPAIIVEDDVVIRIDKE